MRKLHSLEPKEISLVTRGANKKKFLITKALESQMDAETLKKVDDVLKSFDEEDGEKKEGGLSERAKAALKAVARILAPFKEEISDEHLDAVQEELGMKDGDKEKTEKNKAIPEKTVSKEHSDEAMGEAKKAYKAHLEKLGYKKYPDAEMAQKSKTVLEDEDDEDEEDEDVEKSKVSKSAEGLSAFPENQRAQLEAIFKSNADLVAKNVDLEKQLSTEREARVNKEFSERAKEFKHLGNTEEVATILKSLSEKDPESFKKAEAILKAANEQLAKGELFKELGTISNGGPGDAEAKLNALVESVVQKSDGSRTKEQIYDDVLRTDTGRKLYVDMMKSRPGGI